MDQSLKVWPFWEGGIEQLTSPAKHLNSKWVAAGSFCHLHWVCIAHCTECATDNVLSRTHPVCVIWLPGIIIKVRSSWISRGYWKLLHTHYSHMTHILCQKIGSKNVKLGTHLDRCVYKVSAGFFWAFPLQISEYDSPAHKGQAMFLTDVKCADLKIFWENLLLCLSANANN